MDEDSNIKIKTLEFGSKIRAYQDYHLNRDNDYASLGDRVAAFIETHSDKLAGTPELGYLKLLSDELPNQMITATQLKGLDASLIGVLLNNELDEVKEYAFRRRKKYGGYDPFEFTRFVPEYVPDVLCLPLRIGHVVSGKFRISQLSKYRGKLCSEFIKSLSLPSENLAYVYISEDEEFFSKMITSLDESILLLDFSDELLRRIYYVREGGINSIRELVMLTSDEFISKTSLVESTAKKIEYKLMERGLRFGMTEEEIKLYESL